MAGGVKPPKWINLTAQAIALAVFTFGIVIVVVPSVKHLDSLVTENPFRPPLVVETVTATKADGTIEKTETRKRATESLAERALSAGGLILLRLGTVALAAFLAGAVVQRTLLANFAFKLKGLELPALEQAASASDKLIESLTVRVDKLTRGLAAEKRRTQRVMVQVSDGKRQTALLARELASAQRRLTEAGL